MKSYKITGFTNKGKQLNEVVNIDYDGTIGAEFKKYWLQYFRNFVNPLVSQIEVN